MIDVTYGDSSQEGLPVSTGVPFPAGTITEPSSLSVRAPDGEIRPTAGRVLVRHPDGSIRWCLVSFGARTSGIHEVLWDSSSSSPDPSVTVEKNNGVWSLDNGRLQLTFCERGPGPIGELFVDGRSLLAKAQDLSLNVNDASSSREKERNVRVIEQTPLRTRVRVEGAHIRPQGDRCLNYRLDIEIWAGWPVLRLDYHFLNLEAGYPKQHIDRIALDTQWELGSETQRHFVQRRYGLFGISRHVLNPSRVAIDADLTRGDTHVADPKMLLDDTDYPFYLSPPMDGTHDWLGVVGSEWAVYAQLHDFLNTRPNRLFSEKGRLSAELWPDSASPVDLPQGRSKRQTVTLAFIRKAEIESGTEKRTGAPVQAPRGIAAVLNAPVHEGRGCVNPAWIAHCREFEQHVALPVGQHIRVEANLKKLMHLDMPFTKFDVGDTSSHYASSYSKIGGEKRVRPLPGAPAIPGVWAGSKPSQTYIDCHEPVWANNEYDVIHAFANELMRTGRHELMNTLRLAARHNIEVDFMHYSDHKWLHRATPAHSARHTTTGAYPSHFWTEGLLEYYCLTGDEDALEVAIALGEKTIENFQEPKIRKVLWGFSREVGWSVLTLTCLYDITRDKRFKSLLDEMVNYLVEYDREGHSGAINLSAGNDRQSLHRQVVGNFFGYQSMIDAIDKYATVTGRAEVINWLKQLCYDLAEASLDAARFDGQLPGARFGLLLSVGYERTGDTRFLDQMGIVLDQMYWNAPGVMSRPKVKPVASAYRGLPRMFGHAWRHGLLEDYEFPNVKKMKNNDRSPKGTIASA